MFWQLNIAKAAAIFKITVINVIKAMLSEEDGYLKIINFQPCYF